MRITIVIMTVFLVQVSAASVAQQLSLRNSNITLKEVFTQIRKQTGYTVLCESDLMDSKGPVSVNFDKTPLEKAIKELLSKQNLSYEIKNKAIIVTEKAPSFLDKVVDALTPPVNVSGVVLDEKGLPLPGATVKVKGFKQSVVTDKDGKFYLPGVDDNAVLVVSYIGFKEKEIGVKPELSISMELQSDELQEVVVAYGKTTQHALTGSVTVVKGEQIEGLPNRSFDKSLQGLVPGLLITQGSGQPGSGVGNFVIRGISTGGSALDGATTRNPLIVIDGVPVIQDPAQATTSAIAINNPMSQFNPSDIESISVLKDAAAIALYGSKASNGVILVTTKRGKAGKTVINFRHQTDLSTRLGGNAKPLNQQQYLELIYETYKNTDPLKWTDATIKSDLIRKFPYMINSPGDTSFYTAPDWKNALFNKNAATYSNQLSLSGGGEKSLFYLNMEYTDQNGIEKKTGFDRKSVRLNYENRPVDWFKTGINTALSYTIQDYSFSGASETVVAKISPLNSIRNQDGGYIYNYSWGMSQASGLNSLNRFTANPLAAADLNINRNISYRGISNLNAELRFSKWFSFQTNLGVNFMLTEAKEKVHPLLAGASINPGIGRVRGTNIRTGNIINTNMLKFDRSVGVHNFNVLAAQESQILTTANMYLIRTNLANNPLADQLNVGTLSDGMGLEEKQHLLSYFGQANYSYDNKYFLLASARTDGSSLFGDNKKFGTHWSAGAGWVVTEESFMKPVGKVINSLKLRGSIGSAGNSSAILSNLRYDNLRLLNYRGQSAVIPNGASSPGNPGIQWEKTFNWDLGLELKALDNRISFTADVYTKKTSEVIGRVDLPFALGFINLTDNIGDLKNKGVELSVSVDVIRTERLKWNLGMNWSKNTNKLTKSYLPQENVAGTILVNGVGENYNSYYLPTWAGVDPANGKPQWIDTLGNPNSDYNAAKYSFVGKPQPDGFGAIMNTISYKNFELSALLNFQYGFKVYNAGAESFMVNDGVDPFVNQSEGALDRWQKPGDVAANPRRLLFGTYQGNSDRGTSSSTRYLYDGDFIRLSSMSLGYNFPKTWVNRLHLSNLKAFVQGYNLAVWTKYKGQDPENASSVGTATPVYPLQRSFSLGFNVTF